MPIKEKFSVSARTYEEALIDLGPELGDIVGAELTTSAGGDYGPFHYALKDGTAGGVTIEVSGNKNDETIEALGKIIRSAYGVEKNYDDRVELVHSLTKSDNTMMSKSIWQVELNKAMPQEVLKANIIKNAKEVVRAGGKAYMKDVPYRYTYSTIRELAGLTVGDNYATGLLSFKIDRNKMRSWERANKRR